MGLLDDLLHLHGQPPSDSGRPSAPMSEREREESYDEFMGDVKWILLILLVIALIVGSAPTDYERMMRHYR